MAGQARLEESVRVAGYLSGRQGMLAFLTRIMASGEKDGDLRTDRLSTFLSSYLRALLQDGIALPLTEIELNYLPYMIRAGDAHIFDGLINVQSRAPLSGQSRIPELRHLTRLVIWLDDESNRAALETAVIACGQTVQPESP